MRTLTLDDLRQEQEDAIEQRQTGDFSAYFVPTRAFVQSLQVGDFAPDPFGKPARVVSIHGQGEDVTGRAFVCFCTAFGTGSSSISNSLKEGELARSTRITGRHTSRELDAIERQINEERA